MAKPKLKVLKGGRSHDDLTIGQGRDYMNMRMERGAPCLLCGQMCKVHRRTMSKRMFETLESIAGAKVVDGWVDISKLSLKNGGDYAKLRFWGLAEKGKGSLWRVTLFGRDFLANKVGVQKTALVFQNLLVGMEGDEIWAREMRDGGGS